MPKDLTKIKSKAALNLTARQLIIFGAAAVIAVPLFFATKGALGTQGAGFISFVVACPFFLAGLYERNGQPFEKVLINAINIFFRRAKQRPYVSKNYYVQLLDETIAQIIADDTVLSATNKSNRRERNG
jgi:hypothetical protein